MKSTRNTFCFVLAILLICLTALPASAAYRYNSGTYMGADYEAATTCNMYSYVSNTYCIDPAYSLRTDVTAYKLATESNEEGVTATGHVIIFKITGNESAIRCTNSGSSTVELSKIESDHFLNDYPVCTMITPAG